MIGLGSILAGVARALDEARWCVAVLDARARLALWHLQRGGRR